MTDRPIKFDRNADSKARLSPLEDLLDLDSKLLSMVARRCRIVQRAAKGRQVLDRDMEKQLRLGFDLAAKQQDLDPRLARQLFPVLNAFGLEPQEARRSSDKPFALIPRSEPADIDILGPRSLPRTRMLAVLAAASGAPMRLSGVVLNDPLVELVKALNQAGAHLSWTADELTSSAAQGKDEDCPLRFEDVLVFAGEEPFTLFVLLAFALREAGRSKFAGGPNLKFLDLRHLDSLLLHLGARLAPMNPRSRGLPARLESGGRMASRLELTPETPPLFAQAVALAAWSYPEGLRLALCAEPAAAASQALALDEALEALNLCQVGARRQGNEYVIPACRPKVPAAPVLPLDPTLSAYLLALPALAGGVARLAGALALPQFVRDDFDALGLPLNIDPGIAESRNDSLNAGVELFMGRQAEYLPLALTLAVKAGGARVLLPADVSARARAVDLLERLAVEHELTDDALVVLPGVLKSWDGVWTSPDPHTTLALALFSFLRPGIAIDNPGGLAFLWPRFWSVYNALPLVRELAHAPKEPEKHVAKSRNQRVRV
jgi:3-phosphoshikimate 1-carboxyvinyltransferase